jgi:hypothetical protein
MISRNSYLATLAIVSASLTLAACGGGGGDSGNADPTPGSPGGTINPPAAPIATNAGISKGTIVSTTTAGTAAVVALTAHDGHSVWMTTDGRIWSGDVPPDGDRFDATFSGHMYEGDHFPDGTNHGLTHIQYEHHSTSMASGSYSGSGDAGTFSMTMSPMWNRPAALETVAGVYTRSTATGYTMTMTIGANGQMSGSDSRGCVFTGTVSVPDATHNLYGIEADVSSCGTLDGNYRGMGALLDADAMVDWMSAMHPLEHGGHSHGGSMMGGSPMMGGGHNTVPTGQHNLFMFSMVNDHAAIMDALAR